MAKLPWKPWHEVVKLRDDLRSGELPMHMFAADLYEVMMQRGKRLRIEMLGVRVIAADLAGQRHAAPLSAPEASNARPPSRSKVSLSSIGK